MELDDNRHRDHKQKSEANLRVKGKGAIGLRRERVGTIVDRRALEASPIGEGRRVRAPAPLQQSEHVKRRPAHDGPLKSATPAPASATAFLVVVVLLQLGFGHALFITRLAWA